VFLKQIKSVFAIDNYIRMAFLEAANGAHRNVCA